MFKYLAAVPVLSLLLMSGATQSYAADDGAIAMISSVEGTATVTPAGAKDAVPAAAKMRIHMHDVLQTGPKSRLSLQFVDNTQFALAASTKLTVDEYVYDPDNKPENKARYDVVAGTFEYLSGLITKTKNPNVKIQTAYGSIGIRGTHVWGGNVPGHGYGVHDSEGNINVSNSGGSVDFGEGLGTFIAGPGDPPSPPAPWSDDEMAMIQQLLAGGTPANGDQKKLLQDYLNWLHHHGKKADGGPDGNDLPQDETGLPDMVPFTPPVGNNNND